MGGTSADIAFIEGGVPLEVTEGTIARRQIDVPALDMTTISAGGGSIAWIDGGGFLTVGPQSAGADPGPACYGRGGTRPTVTDADLVCGFLNPDYFLGGAQMLDIKAARAALIKTISPSRCGWSLLEAAAGIRRIVDMRMADEVRVFAAKRGVDLSRLHAAAVRRRRRRACRRGRRPSSACAASWCRRGRARSRRWGCCAPTWCTITSAPSSGRSPRSRPTMPRRFSPSSSTRRARNCAPRA